MTLSAPWRPLLVAATVAAIAAVLSSCGMMGAWTSRFDPGRFRSDGERIYFTATNSAGQVIRYDGGPGGAMMMMHRYACVDCHGADGKGGRVATMGQAFDAPNITWSALAPEHHADTQMDHPPYTEETVKRAITRGLDPDGKPLDSPMPRWRMSDQDLDAVIAFLKTVR